MIGKVRYGIVMESAETSDKTTALALAEKKFRQFQEIAPREATVERITIKSSRSSTPGGWPTACARKGRSTL
jgi:hypothetical protein